MSLASSHECDRMVPFFLGENLDVDTVMGTSRG